MLSCQEITYGTIMMKLTLLTLSIFAVAQSQGALANTSKEKDSLLKNGFYEIDEDRSETISKKEAKDNIESLEFTSIDSNNNGVLTMDEWLKYYKLKKRAQN